MEIEYSRFVLKTHRRRPRLSGRSGKRKPRGYAALRQGRLVGSRWGDETWMVWLTLAGETTLGTAGFTAFLEAEDYLLVPLKVWIIF